MEELYQIIKERFNKLKSILQRDFSLQTYQIIREGEKIRCQKQSWILSMLRCRKSLNHSYKMYKNEFLTHIYYTCSYQIMKVIDPEFVYQLEDITDEHFLNDIVCLYTEFFKSFQSKFVFKSKFKNLLRPTNYHLVYDLVKYLADFSRDYFQQILFWHLKNLSSQQSIQQQQKQNEKDNEKVLPLQKNITFSTEMKEGKPSLKKFSEQISVDTANCRIQLYRIYNLLSIQPLPQFIFIEKNRSSIDIMKTKMNELYREAKHRNTSIRVTINSYASNFSLNGVNKQTIIEDKYSNISYPFEISLQLEKNGFSCLNLTLNQYQYKEERSLSPIKNKRFGSFSSNSKDSIIVNQKNPVTKFKKEIILNSLKVLRASENFLPPLLLGGDDEKKSEVQGKTFNQKKNIKTFSKTENINTNKETYEYEKSYGVRYFNDQYGKDKERIMKTKNKIKDLRKHFSSQEKMKKSQKNSSNPQQKLIEWLERINMMKQIEKKKIMGLN